MNKSNFLLEVYNEFSKNITWTKWSELEFSSILVSISIFIISIILYTIDKFFIWFLQIIFSIHF